jgi:acetyltransferase
MSIRNLDRLFHARSVALVGASARPGSLGRAVLDNLRNGGFKGAIHLVNPRHREIEGQICVATLSDLSQTPDVVIIAAPREHVMALAEEAARLGAPVAIVITSDPSGHGPNSLSAQ